MFIHHLVGGLDKDARGGVEAAAFFEWGGQNADGSYGFDAQRPGWGQPIHQLLAAHHVTAVFHGHDHVFVKQELDGLVYQELPQPSNAESRDARLAADYGYTLGDALGGSGHLRVTVTATEVTVEYVRAVLPGAEAGGLHTQRPGGLSLYLAGALAAGRRGGRYSGHAAGGAGRPVKAARRRLSGHGGRFGRRGSGAVSGQTGRPQLLAAVGLNAHTGRLSLSSATTVSAFSAPNRITADRP